MSRNILPKPSNASFSLSKMGYSAYGTKQDRIDVLNNASKMYGTSTVQKHLNLRANYQQWNVEAYDRMKNDIDYLSKKISEEKNKQSRLSSKKKTSKRSSKKKTSKRSSKRSSKKSSKKSNNKKTSKKKSRTSK